MADPIISITFKDQLIQEKLKIVSEKIADPSELMEEFGQIVKLSTDQRWAAELDPDGNTWVENTAYTRALKQAQGFIDKPLQASGRARASIDYEVDKDQVAIGTNVGYMADHQLGANGQKQRKFLGISEEDEIEIAIAADDYIKRTIES